MTYKQKHLAKLAVSAVAALTLSTSCQKQNAPVAPAEKVGLLDDAPHKTEDKYGTQVTVYLVDVPLYNSKGERLKDMYMLTRALNREDFSGYQSGNNLQVRQVCFNGSKESVYVMTDEFGAIKTMRGYVGLFDDKGHAVLVAERNTGEFISDRHEDLRRASFKSNREEFPNPKQDQNVFLPDSTAEQTDTILTNDTLDIRKPSVLSEDTTHYVADTLMYQKQQQNEAR